MIDDRKKNIDKMFIIKKNNKDKLEQIRNSLLGEWAGNKLNLDSNLIKDYIQGVIQADTNNIGYIDVIEKIEKDFINTNIKISYEEIREKLIYFDKLAIEKMSN